jgi:hypothetical protein
MSAHKAETTSTEVVVEEEPKPTLLQRFTTSHPKSARVTAITGALAAAAGAFVVAKNLRANEDELDSAGNHFKEGLTDLTESVSPSEPEA